MVINALNSGAKVFLADFIDAISPPPSAAWIVAAAPIITFRSWKGARKRTYGTTSSPSPRRRSASR